MADLEVMVVMMVVILLLIYGRIYALMQNSCIVKEIENIIFDILLPKLKITTITVFYRPPNFVNFMELIIKDFSHLNLKDNKIYLLGDFIINLLQNGNYILMEKERLPVKDQHIL